MYPLPPCPRVLMITNAGFLPAVQGDAVRLNRLIVGLKESHVKVGVMNVHDDTQTGGVDYVGMRASCDFVDIHFPTRQEIGERNSEIDSWCSSRLLKACNLAIKKFKPTAILTQFAYLSRCLLEVPNKGTILRILDADNVFFRRKLSFANAGIADDWFETDIDQEVQAWRRADVILAIQQHEKEIISQFVPGKTVLLTPPYLPAKKLREPIGNSLLFIGANNPVNRSGLHCFLKQVFPTIVAHFPDCTLNIVGGVCEAINEPHDSAIILHGLVDNLESHYGNSTVVLNLAEAASGINMKLAEAMAYGRCVISTKSGMGALHGLTDAVVVADDINAMTPLILSLLGDQSRVMAARQRSFSFASKYFSDSYAVLPLVKILEAHNCKNSSQGYRKSNREGY